jgi:hypothetical protein
MDNGDLHQERSLGDRDPATELETLRCLERESARCAELVVRTKPPRNAALMGGFLISSS